MLILGGTCAVLVEAAELILWSNDRRRARLHPDPYAGLADFEIEDLNPKRLADKHLFGDLNADQGRSPARKEDLRSWTFVPR